MNESISNLKLKYDPAKIKVIKFNSELINVVLGWGSCQPYSKDMPNDHFPKDKKNK
jgi:hypothetical protein